MPKKRVNITIDSAVHQEMRKFLDLTGSDFSAYVESVTVHLLGEMRPLVRRMEAALEGGTPLSPSEMRVMFLQLMGGLHVKAGAEMGTILQELDTLEQQQKVISAPKNESIHTQPKKRSVAKKK